MKLRPQSGEFERSLLPFRQGTRPIIVGPFLGEVGYELLYWIPFVAWLQQQFRIDPSRLIVVSRGGCQSWYAHITARYLDIFRWYTTEQFRAENVARSHLQDARRTTLKQVSMTPFDRAILAHAEREIGTSALILHPSVLYRLFFSCRPQSPKCQQHARHRPFQPVAPLEGLPARYVAVRCYTSAICPGTPEVRALLTDWLRTLLCDTDVVLLQTGSQYDDHAEMAFEDLIHPRLHRIVDRVTPATNLDVQTRVIAGATKYLGTYGGYSYLAPLLGVNADTVYMERTALAKFGRHLTLAKRIFLDNNRFGWLAVNSLRSPHEAYA